MLPSTYKAEKRLHRHDCYTFATKNGHHKTNKKHIKHPIHINTKCVYAFALYIDSFGHDLKHEMMPPFYVIQ